MMRQGILSFFVLLLFIACGDGDGNFYHTETGGKNQPCNPDGTCDQGLECQEGICLDIPDAIVPDTTDTDSDNDSDNDVSVPTFRTVWQTDATGADGKEPDNPLSITLPLVENGQYDFMVSWGDGTTDHIVKWDASERTHVYEKKGTYKIEITGTISGWSFNNQGDKYKLQKISEWGPLAFGKTEGQFFGCHYLEISALDAPDLSQTVSLKNAFRDCLSLKKLSDDEIWDTSRITDMSYAFFNCVGFTQGIKGWNTSKVTTMAHMFEQAQAYNEDIGLWDVSHVTDMTALFRKAYLFNGDIEKWHTDSLTDFTHAFEQTYTFNRPLNDWNVSRVTAMDYLFAGAKAFNQNLSSWETGKVTSFYHTFENAVTFNGDIGAWNTSSATTMENMFAGASSFNKDISAWDTSHVVTMRSCFLSADAFNQPLNPWDTSSVTNMESMFTYAQSFNQPLGNWNVAQVTSMVGMFEGASAFDQDLSSWNVAQVKKIWGFLRNTSFSTEHYDALLIKWSELPVLQHNVNFGAGTTTYSPGKPAEARQKLIDEYQWHITDGGEQQ